MNVSRCKVLHRFPARGSIQCDYINLKPQLTISLKPAKNLGIIFRQTLPWESHYEYALFKAYTIFGVIKSLAVQAFYRL